MLNQRLASASGLISWLLLLVLATAGGGCQSASQDAQAGLAPVAAESPTHSNNPGSDIAAMGKSGLPQLPAQEFAPRAASFTNVIYSKGNAVYDTSPGCIFAGDSVVLQAAPGAMAYAMYAFNTGGYDPNRLEVGLAAGNNSTAWVGISNYAAGTWQFFGPFTAMAQLDLTGFGYLSGTGQCFALVLAYNGASVSSDYLALSFDNAIPVPFSISGTVQDEHAAALGGVRVSINPEFTEAMTDAQGRYFIPCTAAGSYTVTPDSLDGFTFNPPSTVVNVTGEQTGVDFTASRVDVMGRITTAEGAGVAGVALTLEPGGRTAQSGAGGGYVFASVAAGNYTVAPVLAGYTFQPLGRNVTVAAADYTGADFTATGGAPTWAIRGKVALASLAGVAGVTLVLEPGYRIATTDASGDFAFFEVGDGTYHLEPHLGFYTFSPVQSTVIVDGASVNNADFTATPPPPTYTISGVLKDSVYSEGIPNARVRVIVGSSEILAVYTGSTGAYSFTVPDGTYLVYPQKAYYQMSSPFVTVNGAGKTVNLIGHMPNGATWDSFANAYISNNCIQCHRPDSVTAANPPLRTYSEVVAAGSLCNSRVQNNSMPPGWTNLPLYQKYFQEWHDNGFPEH